MRIVKHPAPPVSDDGEAPVLNLSSARQRRHGQAEEAAAQEREARRKAWQSAHEAQRRLLQVLIASGRLPFAYFVDMLRLGIVTEQPARLPCGPRALGTPYYDWVQAEWREDAEDPDGDLIDELVAKLQERGVPMTGMCEQLTQIRQRKVPPPNQVRCPLWDYEPAERSPCAHALLHREITRWEDGRLLQEPIATDPADPVLRAGLRPCVVLGQELLHSLTPGVFALEQKWLEEDK